MPTKSSIGAFIGRFVPPRIMYLSSRGSVYFYELSTRFQIAFYVMMYVFLGWVAYASVIAVFYSGITIEVSEQVKNRNAILEAQVTSKSFEIEELNALLLMFEDRMGFGGDKNVLEIIKFIKNQSEKNANLRQDYEEMKVSLINARRHNNERNEWYQKAREFLSDKINQCAKYSCGEAYSRDLLSAVSAVYNAKSFEDAAFTVNFNREKGGLTAKIGTRSYIYEFSFNTIRIVGSFIMNDRVFYPSPELVYTSVTGALFSIIGTVWWFALSLIGVRRKNVDEEVLKQLKELKEAIPQNRERQ